MNEPVLLLNANFAPLNVCNTRRAIGLVLAGKAEMMLDGRGVIQTVREIYPRPSVIRLGYMVKRPRPRVRLTKKEIFRRDKHTCQYCGARASRMTIDHVIPKHKGGDHTWHNLVTACDRCNLQKGGRTADASRLTLRKKPSEPRASALYLYGAHLPGNDEWLQFLEGW
jgi:5-methylcytosine-specific restriction endonuclease McrA